MKAQYAIINNKIIIPINNIYFEKHDDNDEYSIDIYNVNLFNNLVYVMKYSDVEKRDEAFRNIITKMTYDAIVWIDG